VYPFEDEMNFLLLVAISATSHYVARAIDLKWANIYIVERIVSKHQKK